MRVFKNRVLRRIFGPKRDEVTGSGENYIMEVLNYLYSSQYYMGDQTDI
jgi:hypothetical protein